jgi:hypothetical protein
MKFTKFFFGVFLLTFLIGYISVPPPARKSAVPQRVIDTIPHDAVGLVNERRFEPEVFDVIDVWEEEPDFKVNLIDIAGTGNNYRKDEIKAKSGERWLGLYNEGGEFRLRFTKIKVRPESRPDYGYDNSVTIKVNNKIEPIFLLKNARTLREGEVKTLFDRPLFEETEATGIELPALKQGFAQNFKFGESNYTFRVKEGLTRSNEKILVLVLETETASQIIHFIYYNEPGAYVGRLLWTGDLDRDGKLDLYMDYYNYEKGGFSSGLFLSSEAEKGKLVKKVAHFEKLGC